MGVGRVKAERLSLAAVQRREGRAEPQDVTFNWGESHRAFKAFSTHLMPSEARGQSSTDSVEVLTLLTVEKN